MGLSFAVRLERLRPGKRQRRVPHGMRVPVERAPQVERAVDHQVCSGHRLSRLMHARNLLRRSCCPPAAAVAKCRGALRQGALWPLAAPEVARTLRL